MAAKLIGAGLATIALGGAATGVGTLFGALITGTSRNPALRKELFNVAILGFALTEALGLFSLMMSLLFLYAFLLMAPRPRYLVGGQCAPPPLCGGGANTTPHLRWGGARGPPPDRPIGGTWAATRYKKNANVYRLLCPSKMGGAHWSSL